VFQIVLQLCGLGHDAGAAVMEKHHPLGNDLVAREGRFGVALDAESA